MQLNRNATATAAASAPATVAHETALARFTSGPVAALALAASLLANVALGGVALHTSGHLPFSGSTHVARVTPNLKAYYVEGQREGRLGAALPAAVPSLKAFANPYAGEGRLNVARAAATQLVAHNAPYMGEGRLNVRRHNALPYAVTGCGQGEGLLQHALPVENPCD